MDNPLTSHQLTRLQSDLGNPGVEGGEVFRRGGTNCGSEDFALCKCPHCGRIYLLDNEVETIFTDPSDLTRRVALWAGIDDFRCVRCDLPFPHGVPWHGPQSPVEMQVTWHDLAVDPWRWVTRETRG